MSTTMGGSPRINVDSPPNVSPIAKTKNTMTNQIHISSTPVLISRFYHPMFLFEISGQVCDDRGD